MLTPENTSPSGTPSIPGGIPLYVEKTTKEEEDRRRRKRELKAENDFKQVLLRKDAKSRDSRANFKKELLDEEHHDYTQNIAKKEETPTQTAYSIFDLSGKSPTQERVPEEAKKRSAFHYAQQDAHFDELTVSKGRGEKEQADLNSVGDLNELPETPLRPSVPKSRDISAKGFKDFEERRSEKATAAIEEHRPSFANAIETRLESQSQTDSSSSSLLPNQQLADQKQAAQKEAIRSENEAAQEAGEEIVMKKLSDTPELPTASNKLKSAEEVRMANVNSSNIAANKANTLSTSEPIEGNLAGWNKEKFGTRQEFAQELPDQAAIQPGMVLQAMHIENNFSGVEEKFLQAAQPQLQEIVDQIVDKVYTLTSEGMTETTIVLKNTRLFDGAEVTLTSYDSARGEFNLTFNNLTQEAKNLLDRQLSQNTLQQALHEKGFTVHILVTTTLTAETAAEEHARNWQRDEDANQQQRRRRNEEFEDVDENEQ